MVANKDIVIKFSNNNSKVKFVYYQIPTILILIQGHVGLKISHQLKREKKIQIKSRNVIKEKDVSFFTDFSNQTFKNFEILVEDKELYKRCVKEFKSN